MNLYHTTAEMADFGRDGSIGVKWHSSWEGTQADARAKRAQLKLQGFRNIHTESEVVPTDKNGLLNFLNENKVKGIHHG